MKALYEVASLRRVEQLANNIDLIERAGASSAAWLCKALPEAVRFTILIGPGNNGQDALACARHLHQVGKQISLVTTAERKVSTQLPKELGTPLISPPSDWGDVIIDGLFGIGLNRTLDAATCRLIDAANQAPSIRVALDIPTGLDAASGSASPVTFVADITLSFIADKPGFYTAQGKDFCGQIHTFDLAIPHLLPDPDALLINHRTDLPLLNRPHASNKGSFGTVAIIGGQSGMVGAALLAGRAALHSGAGKVYVGLLDDRIAVDFVQPELMLQPAAQLFDLPNIDTWVVGPGLGKSIDARQLLAKAVEQAPSLVLDADALNLLAADAHLVDAVRKRSHPTAITPHPGEAARLLGTSIEAVQKQRLQSARALARQFNVNLVLKGAGGICSDDQHVTINGSGNALLANAGQGDVLSGIVGALIAQGLATMQALQLASFLHGQIADIELQQHPGAGVLCASRVIDALSRRINATN